MNTPCTFLPHRCLEWHRFLRLLQRERRSESWTSRRNSGADSGPGTKAVILPKDFQEFDLCRDVLQLDPDMVLFTIDGKDYTVLQYAKEIVTAADSVNHPMHRDPDPPALLRNPEGFCDYILAPMTLAESVGVSLTETEEAALCRQLQKRRAIRDFRPAIGFGGIALNFWKTSWTHITKSNMEINGIQRNFISMDFYMTKVIVCIKHCRALLTLTK